MIRNLEVDGNIHKNLWEKILKYIPDIIFVYSSQGINLVDQFPTTTKGIKHQRYRLNPR